MDINKLMQQAQSLQKQIEKTTNEINSMEFVGKASDGLVEITINGENKVLSVSINDELVDTENKEILEDMIMIAFNDAVSKANEYKENRFAPLAAMSNLPIK